MRKRWFFSTKKKDKIALLFAGFFFAGVAVLVTITALYSRLARVIIASIRGGTYTTSLFTPMATLLVYALMFIASLCLAYGLASEVEKEEEK